MDWIGRHAAATPGKTAIRYGGRDLSYRDFAALIERTAGALAAALLLAGALVMDGSFQLAAALHLRPLAAWRWLLASALTSLSAAALLAFGLPARTPDAVAILLAAAFATTGLALVAASFARHAPRRGDP